MASDKLFNRSKAARKLKKLKTSSKKRSSETIKTLERILIVSEGEKTEPIYFELLVEKFKLQVTDVKVTGSLHSCPLKVVEHAIKLYEKSIKDGASYDSVYCVIDKDSHAKYDMAINKLITIDDFHAINSIPCFELWLLLHYNYTTKPFSKTANKSICQALISKDLKKHLPKYVKNISNLDQSDIDFIFDETNINNAINRSEKLMKHCEDTNTENPFTKIHILVKKLKELKEKKKELLIQK